MVVLFSEVLGSTDAYKSASLTNWANFNPGIAVTNLHRRSRICLNYNSRPQSAKNSLMFEKKMQIGENLTHNINK